MVYAVASNKLVDEDMSTFRKGL